MRLPSVALLAVLFVASPAQAFSTRIHIVFANRLREQLILTGDGTIPLQMGAFHVQLTQPDADAIVNHPFEFRAGAIGPDSFVFVALTDGTHSIENNPYTQCQLLYDDATTDDERAYALGCFVHGATDAVAHHFVNYFSGETWTNNPVMDARASGWSNAIRHIIMESGVQRSVYAADPTALDSASLQLQFPDGFVLRNYYDNHSRLWPVLAIQATRKLDAARLAMPTASLYTQIQNASLAPVEYVELSPLVVDDLQTRRESLRTWALDQITQLQDPTTTDGSALLVGPGPDGVLSTMDDTTACSASCATAFAKYWVYVRMLQPRMDASGHVLPSAYDKVSDELGRNLQQFLPALVATIENIVAALNAPITADAGDAFENVDAARIEMLLQPMRDWVTMTTTLDYDTISRAVAPDWYTSLSDFFAGFGISISIGDILQLVFQPYIDAIRDAVQDFVIEQARMYVETLIDQFNTGRAAIESEYTGRLAASAPADLGGDTALDHFFDSGLFANGFNLAAATLANHDVMVPPAGTDSVETGPASFDASYTVTWSQAALCPYLRSAIFPLGYDVHGDLSVRDAAGDHLATNMDDSNVECEDGSLSAWDPTPGPDSCTFVPLDQIISSPTHRGSPSRAYPPLYDSMPAGCRNITVPGLPPPPALPDGGMPGTDGGTSGLDGSAGADAGRGPAGGGCGCVVAGARSTRDAGALFALALLALVVSRRRRSGRDPLLFSVPLLALPLLLGGCSAGSGDGMDSGTTSDAGGSDGHTTLDAPMSMDAGSDAGPMVDAGPNPRRLLLDALGTSVWSSMQTRTEGTTPVTRVYELKFRAADLLWGETRNPFGPARNRRMRSFMIAADGATVMSTVITPAGWTVPPDNGQRDMWTFEVVDGSPRLLRITDAAGATEEYTEGAWPAPTDGLTAEVRVFPAGGATDMALCTSGIGSIDRNTIWGFARGTGADSVIETDVVAGAHLREWNDMSSGHFGVTDIDGFDQNGGTLLSDTGNFTVRYRGVVHFPAGGALWARETDDRLSIMALWMFGDTDVGSTSSAALWLEVVGYSSIIDATSDPNSITVAGGDVPIEVIILRCAGSSSRALDAELSLDDQSSYQFVGDSPTAPTIDDTLFPPTL